MREIVVRLNISMYMYIIYIIGLNIHIHGCVINKFYVVDS